MKVLLLFVSVVCVVQANVVVQVIQEAGEDGKGQEVGEDGYGDDKEGGGGEDEGGREGGRGGEGGGGNGLVTLQNHQNDLNITLSNLEDRLIAAKQVDAEVWNLTEPLSYFFDFLMNGGSAGRHRRSIVDLEDCEPDVDLNGDLGSVLIRICGALVNELSIIGTSLDLTKWRCYKKIVDSIDSNVRNGTLDAPDYNTVKGSGVTLAHASDDLLATLLSLMNSLKVVIADVQAQIAEMGGTTEEAAGTSNE